MQDLRFTQEQIFNTKDSNLKTLFKYIFIHYFMLFSTQILLTWHPFLKINYQMFETGK